MPICSACQMTFDNNYDLQDHLLICDGENNEGNQNPYGETYDFDTQDGAFIDEEEAYDNHDWDAADG